MLHRGERRGGQRRVGVRGYGLERRMTIELAHIGMDLRRAQRRRQDRRSQVRRDEDLPYESDMHK